MAGTYLWLKHELKLTKREVKRQLIQGLDDSELVSLKFSKSEKDKILKWKHSKEFEYGGEMYDVISFEEKGDSVFYKCWWDNKETKLNKQLANLLNSAMGNNPKNKENEKRLVNFYKSLFHQNIAKPDELNNIVDSKLYCSLKVSFYNINSPAPPVPPPEKR